MTAAGLRARRSVALHKLLSWLDELAWVCAECGVATTENWHERVRTDVSRASSDRQFIRLKASLVALNVPHRAVRVEARDSIQEGIKVDWMPGQTDDVIARCAHAA